MKDWLGGLARFLPGHEAPPPEPEGVQPTRSLDAPEKIVVSSAPKVAKTEPARRAIFSFPEGEFLGYREDPPELDEADFDVLSDAGMAAFLAETDV